MKLGVLGPIQFMAIAFSILERIDVGETAVAAICFIRGTYSFSILERIDVGETTARHFAPLAAAPFQYPRTDRRG